MGESCYCGEPWVVRGDESQTCVGYFSPPGHDHDDNCVVRYYLCAGGHARGLSLRRRCPYPGCGWVGKAECRCHPDPKIDGWPAGVRRTDDAIRVVQREILDRRGA